MTPTDRVRSYDELFDDFFGWLAGLYDPDTGGFYYAPSAREEDRFEPDIESTAQTLSILDDQGMIEDLPPDMRDDLIAFFRERQDSETGFFYERHVPEMRENERMVGRALGYATSALETLNAEPRHPLPDSEDDDGDFAKFESLDAYRAWLDDRPWHRGWTALDHINAQSNLIDQLSTDRREEIVAYTDEYLRERQDEVTGLWGQERPYVEISGAFKAALSYRTFDRPVPRADRIFESLQWCLRLGVCDDFCFVRNPVDLLRSIQSQVDPTEEELAEIVEITVENARTFRQSDGGFSRKPDGAPVAPNAFELGLGREEGDLNAGSQAARTVRPIIYDVAGLEYRPSDSNRDFWRTLAGRDDVPYDV